MHFHLYCFNIVQCYCLTFYTSSLLANASIIYAMMLPWCFDILQVQEKKVKRVSVMNLDTSQSSGNGSTSSPGTNSCKALLPNGGCSEKLYHPNNNMSFPPGGCTSLRLPVVVVLNTLYPSSLVLYSMMHHQYLHMQYNNFLLIMT